MEISDPEYWFEEELFVPLLPRLPDDLEALFLDEEARPDPLLEVLRPPPELLDAPLEPPLEAAFLGALFLEALFLDALFLLAPFLEAAFLGALFLEVLFLDALFLLAPFLEADFLDALFLLAPFLDADFLLAPFLEALFLDALFLDADFLLAPFLEAPLDEDLPPERFEAPFFDAAFLVDFAIFNGIYEGLINFLF